MSKDNYLTFFGGTGDLTFRKLLPALYNMEAEGTLPENLKLVLIGRRFYTHQSYCEAMQPWILKNARKGLDANHFQAFCQRIDYFQMDFTDIQEYAGLNAYFQAKQVQDFIFYFAVAPRFFSTIVQGLESVEHAKKGKVILEKPFGEDLKRAKELNQQLDEAFSPQQIYRIDHYLGKEMIRGINAIRFTNPIFSSIWDAKHIESIEISAMEMLGVEQRGNYYDHAGALQDMVQNHLFQILSILAMEQPAQFSGAAMHEEQLRVLQALRLPTHETLKENVVLGQYEGYLNEAHVAPDSTTETFAALRLFVDNERWQGMPFYIRTGKKMSTKSTRAIINFKKTDFDVPQNKLSIHIQPDEGIDLQFNMKKPGETDEITVAHMDICQNCTASSQENTPEAYERLLSACFRSEQSWFSKWDQIEIGWQMIEKLKVLCEEAKLPTLRYSGGSQGPEASDAMLKQNQHQWHE